jgi:hypothetical protein
MLEAAGIRWMVDNASVQSNCHRATCSGVIVSESWNQAMENIDVAVVARPATTSPVDTDAWRLGRHAFV